MAIVIQNQPQSFTPSNNAIIFQVESTEEDILYFGVTVTEAGTGNMISYLEMFTTPNYTNGSYIDISRIMQSAVSWEVDNSQVDLILPVTKPILQYKVTIDEWIVTGGVKTKNSTLIIADTFTVFNAILDRYTFINYVFTDYVITTGAPAQFLTNKPNNSFVNDYSSEQLFFMQSAMTALNVIVTTYDNSNIATVYTTSVNDLATNQMFRLQVSPKVLKNALSIDFTNIKNYTVQIQDGSAVRKSEIKNYNYSNKNECHIYPQNIFWANNLGGIDCYQFLNVEEQNDIIRNSIIKSPFNFSDGTYSDKRGDVLNPTELIYYLTQEGNYTAYSNVISDEEAKWLNELFSTYQAFVELGDEGLVPVMITNTSYKVLKQRASKTAPISTILTYKLNGALIPTSSTTYDLGFGSGELQVSFIDSQMNTP